MLDYTNVTREIRSMISRRRELLTFLGTAFAALGIFLQNVLQGALPPVYHRLQEHGFAYYALLLLTTVGMTTDTHRGGRSRHPPRRGASSRRWARRAASCCGLPASSAWTPSPAG